MKRLLTTLLFISLAIVGNAQIQHGVVKTRGRLLNDGTVKPGVALSTVIIKIKGGNVCESDANGEFSFHSSQGSFYIENIIKEGYVPVDSDIYSIKFNVDSSTPLYITMDVPEEIIADVIRTERKMKESLVQQIEERKKEFEDLVRRNEITQAEYNRRLDSISVEHDRYKKFIEDLSKECASVDFDLVDKGNMHIYNLILSGDIDMADSLLNARGVVEDDIESLLKRREYNKEVEAGLKSSEEEAERNTKALANKYYNRYLLCVEKEEIDSAYYYISRCSRIDKKGVNYQLELADFLAYKREDYEAATEAYQEALERAEDRYGAKHKRVVEIYCRIADWYDSLSYYEWACEFVQKAYDLLIEISPNDEMVESLSEKLEELQFMVEIYGSSHS